MSQVQHHNSNGITYAACTTPAAYCIPIAYIMKGAAPDLGLTGFHAQPHQVLQGVQPTWRGTCEQCQDQTDGHVTCLGWHLRLSEYASVELRPITMQHVQHCMHGKQVSSHLT